MKGNFNYNIVFPSEIVQFDPIAGFNGDLLYSDGKNVFSIKEKPPFESSELFDFLQIEGIIQEKDFVMWIKEKKGKLKTFSDENVLFLASLCSLNFAYSNYSNSIIVSTKRNVIFSSNATKTEKMNPYGLSIEENSQQGNGIPFNPILQNVESLISINYSSQAGNGGQPSLSVKKAIESIHRILYGKIIISYLISNIVDPINPALSTLDISVKWPTFGGVYGVGAIINSINPFAKESLLDRIAKLEVRIHGNLNHKFIDIKSNLSSKLQAEDNSFNIISKYNFFHPEREKAKYGGKRTTRKEETFSNLYNDLGNLNSAIAGSPKISYGDDKTASNVYKTFLFDIKNKSAGILDIFDKPLDQKYPSYSKISFPVVHLPWKKTDFLADFELNANSMLYFSKNVHAFNTPLIFKNHAGASNELLRMENYHYGSYPQINKSISWIKEEICGFLEGTDFNLDNQIANYQNQFVNFLKGTYAWQTFASQDFLICSHENIGYSIRRFNINSQNEQTYFISSHPLENFFASVYDTQILYDEVYLYFLGQQNFVHGRALRYDLQLKMPGEQILPTKFDANINVKQLFFVGTKEISNKLSPALFKYNFIVTPDPHLFFKENPAIVSLFDKIPTAPDVTIKHFNGTNKIDVLVDPSINTYHLSKEDYFKQVAKMNELLPFDDELNLDEELLEQINAIALFSKSSKYSDLQKEEKEIIFGFENDIKYHFCILLDKNKKVIETKKNKFSMRFCLDDNEQYYLICFSVDLHNKISPLIIYKIKIFNTDSIIFTEKKVIEFEELFGEAKAKKEEVSFRHSFSFSLKDSIKHYNQVDFYKILEKEMEDSFYLPSENNLQSRSTIPQIKIRVKSKKSGRKFDLNVKIEREIVPYSNTTTLKNKLKETQTDLWNVQKLTP